MPNTREEMRARAYALVARAQADPEFARRAKADPTAALREAGLPEDSLRPRDQEEFEAELPPWCTCNDFTCWSSACPGTCVVSFCGSTIFCEITRRPESE